MIETKDRIAALEKAMVSSGYEESGDYSTDLVQTFVRDPSSGVCSLEHVMLPFAPPVSMHMSNWGKVPGNAKKVFPGQGDRECEADHLHRLTIAASKVFVRGKTAIVAVPSTPYADMAQDTMPAELMAEVLHGLVDIGGYDTLIAVDEKKWNIETARMSREEGLPVLYDSTGVSGELVCPENCEEIRLGEIDKGYCMRFGVSFPKEWVSEKSRRITRLLALDSARRETEEALRELLDIPICDIAGELPWIVSSLSYGVYDISEQEGLLMTRKRAHSPGVMEAFQMRSKTDLFEHVEHHDEGYHDFAISTRLWMPLCHVRESSLGERCEFSSLAKEVADAFSNRDNDKKHKAMQQLIAAGRELGIDAAYESIRRGVPPDDVVA